ncbi:MAG: hypothetical protein J6K22_09405, partial [Spirochaetaceae bacterium]|nr:hypothetical protein [Spirochaetaceae bacterium]
HIKTEIEHYVVVYKIKKNKVYISDPAIGLIKEDLKSFLEKWSGVFFLFLKNDLYLEEFSNSLDFTCLY